MFLLICVTCDITNSKYNLIILYLKYSLEDADYLNGIKIKEIAVMFAYSYRHYTFLHINHLVFH